MGCDGGTCKCGSAASCEGETTGAFCDATNNVCKCSADVDKCTAPNECNNGQCADPCDGITCAVADETCDGGTCKCGSAASCEGQTTGAFCDATNNVCKC